MRGYVQESAKETVPVRELFPARLEHLRHCAIDVQWRFQEWGAKTQLAGFGAPLTAKASMPAAIDVEAQGRFPCCGARRKPCLSLSAGHR
ncbi:hypothetical protein GCM10023214_26650 [Amycolatopsis dongchuanensis]|uniref:Uncharacterized protein n=1 Tax=Amycolatopsis dongchuanensis TaxID=1070866 RepID=A0ABP9QGG8_9PSEU